MFSHKMISYWLQKKTKGLVLKKVLFQHCLCFERSNLHNFRLSTGMAIIGLSEQSCRPEKMVTRIATTVCITFHGNHFYLPF